jgi:conserved hypothetical protein
MSKIIKPQKGPQEKFLATNADIAIYGGAAGGGKTYALLMEPLRYIYMKGYRAVVFRKNYTQINTSGGLWDESTNMYLGIYGAVPTKSPKYRWTFAKKSILYFDYLGRDEDLSRWQGSQITFIGFDELTHFSQRQFFYMMSRNRSICGVKPYIRATCNPDADSWVASFISWWIDQDTGYPIKERSGKIRYMARINDEIIWGNTIEELIAQDINHSDIKSVTFIASTLHDNKILMEKDPAYISNLKALPIVERERLLHGNWKIKAAAGLYYQRTQVTMIDELPKDIVLWCRGWDLAATSEDESGESAYTASVLIGKRRSGNYVIADVINKRLKAAEVRKLIQITCKTDKAKYGRVVERLPKDPGQAGKEQAESYLKMLAGYLVKAIAESGSKESRAEPLAAQWQGGNVEILTAEWNEMYFNQMESFPESKFKDMVDASSSAFNEIEHGATYSVPVSNDSLSKSSYWRR